MKNIRLLFTALFSILLLVSLSACGGDAGNGGTGTLSLSLTDATTADYKAIYVTVKEVRVHRKDGSGWQVAATPNKTYNLLELVNGVREHLGIAELQTGFYTQMRLIIGDTADGGINIKSNSHPFANYFIDSSDFEQELKIPSGPQTGIKISGFFINQDETTELILDFDASKSIVKAGSSGKWLLKPTIKVLNTEYYSRINGTVDTIEGVLVSAQTYDSSASDAQDEVLVQTATLTDVDGSYKMFLEPGTYNIVAYKEGNSPACSRITANPDTIHTQNITLSPASTGNISGSVDIFAASDEQHVTLSIRRSIVCQGVSTSQQIEVKSVNIANGGAYSINLPYGDYNFVASTYGYETREYAVTIPSPVTILELLF
ncbi:MAG: DUF4382 domain-containing protein [Gammaproteobacteria bacterium]|nr:DUF4382 domain-containing protein [Gammaproteobacteria bacterium]